MKMTINTVDADWMEVGIMNKVETVKSPYSSTLRFLVAAMASIGLGGCTESPDSSCKIEDLHGSYVATGTLTNAPSGSGAENSAYMQALFSFSGTGQVEIFKGLSSGYGGNKPWEGEGDYSVEPDCSGKIGLFTKVGGGVEARMNFDFLMQEVAGEIVLESIFVTHPGSTSGHLTFVKTPG